MENSKVATLKINLPDGAKAGDTYIRKEGKNEFINVDRNHCSTWELRFVENNPDFFMCGKEYKNVVSFFTTNQLRDGDKRTYIFEIRGEIPIDLYSKVKTAIEMVINKI